MSLTFTETNFNTYKPDSFEQEALGTINSEKTQWDDATVWVTEKESYQMRNIIKQARRYYYGIFNKQYDEITGEKKTWVPMTQTAVESVVKSIDLDTKDVLISPGNPSTVNIVPLIRSAILNLFKKIGFGKLLNEFTGVLARDGTVVVKSFIDIDSKTGKRVIRSKIVDLLNLWIDPAADDMQSSTVIERSPVSAADMQAYASVWQNTDKAVYTTNVPKITNVFNNASSGLPETDVWERWGKIRKSWVTRDHADDNTFIEGHIVASGVGSAQVIHLIRKNPRKDGRKPYEECRYRKINGRWYGYGIPEMLFGLQEYMNTIVNIRKANNLVLQNGIFLIRKGSGITPDMLSSITAGGGLPVTNIQNDIKQLTVQDYRQSSYTDEDRTYLMADRVTGAFDITRGEVGRASASATATITRDKNIRDTFVLIQENMGFFIEDLIVHQYIPMLKETMTEDDFIKVSGDSAILSFIDEQIVNRRVNDFIQKSVDRTGFRPEPEAIDEFTQKQQQYLQSMGKMRFVKYFSTLFDEEVDIEVNITDEKFNRVVAAQQIRDALIAYSRLPVASKLDADALMRELFNVIGLNGEFFLQEPAMPLFTQKQQAGRLLKQLPTGMPSELAANMAAAGTQQGAAVPPGQNQQYPDFQTRVNIAAPLSNMTG